jgi:hypothetical protein
MFVADMFKSRGLKNLFLRHQLSIALKCAPPRLRLCGYLALQLRRRRSLLRRPVPQRDRFLARHTGVNCPICDQLKQSLLRAYLSQLPKRARRGWKVVPVTRV